MTEGDWNEVTFDSPINVTGNFYIGFEITYTGVDTFVVAQSKDRTLWAPNSNTMYVTFNGSWSNVSTTFQGFETSLAMYVVKCEATQGDAPVADFYGTPTSITEGGSVSFHDQSTNAPTSWAWTFGDGSSSTDQNPSHVYAGAGTYTVALTATNSTGNNTKTRTAYINVTTAGGTTTGCDTLTALYDTDQITYYGLGTAWGYVSGHNEYGFNKFADAITSSGSGEITSMMYYPAIISGSSDVTFKVYSTGTTPGSELGSQTVNMGVMTPGGWNEVLFDTPVSVTGDFYMGYEITYNGTDTFVVAQAADRKATMPGTNTMFVTYQDAWTNVSTLFDGGFDTGLAMYAVKCQPNDIDLFEEEGISLYPNPNNGEFTLEMNNNNNSIIRIIDMNGKVVLTSKINSTESKFNISNYGKGIYMVQIITDNNIVTRKISVQ